MPAGITWRYQLVVLCRFRRKCHRFRRTSNRHHNHSTNEKPGRIERYALRGNYSNVDDSYYSVTPDFGCRLHLMSCNIIQTFELNYDMLVRGKFGTGRSGLVYTLGSVFSTVCLPTVFGTARDSQHVSLHFLCSCIASMELTVYLHPF